MEALFDFSDGRFTRQVALWSARLRVIDPQGELVCLALYEKGAKEVIRRLKQAA